MLNRHIILFYVLISINIFSGCDFQKEIQIDIPVADSLPVVEAFFNSNQIGRLRLTYSTSYFDSIYVPLIDGAYVELQNGKQKYFFENYNRIDFETSRFHNYHSLQKIIFNPGDTLILRVAIPNQKDTSVCTSVVLQKPILDSVFFGVRATDSMAYMVAHIKDIGTEPNFYRLIINVDSLYKNSRINFYFDNRNAFQNLLSVRTNYSFKSGDSLFFRVFRVSEAYYNYLETLSDASRANGNPFAQPALVQSMFSGYAMGAFWPINSLDTLIIVPNPI